MTSDDRTLDTIAADLARRFGDAVPYQVIRETAEECLGRWPDARIRDFVPLLAGRCASDRLRQRAERGRAGKGPSSRRRGRPGGR